MRGYGQFCPIATASEVLGERWTTLIIRELGAGSETFNALRRGLPLTSPTILSFKLPFEAEFETPGQGQHEQGSVAVPFPGACRSVGCTSVARVFILAWNPSSPGRWW